MKLYHYTNIWALALILKNRTIRFNRLDQVDDLEEGNGVTIGVQYGKYVFASCWTESAEESIPLWKMYGGDKGGVRIAVDKQMFQQYLVSDLKFGELHTEGSMLSVIPKEEFLHSEYFVMPLWNYESDTFYRRVKYVDDVAFYTKKAGTIENVQGDRGTFCIKTGDFGTYKNKRWAFQQESRFVLNIFPFNPLLSCQHPDIGSLAIQEFRSNKDLPFTFYDLHLRDEAVNNMEIVLSPSSTEADRLIVEALVEKYASSARVLPSVLGQVVRLK